MATAISEAPSCISHDALNLLDCFTEDLYTAVRDMAEKLAVKEGSVVPGNPAMISVEDRHIRQAGKSVIEAMRQMIASGDAPVEMRPALEDIGECFQSKN